MVIVRSMSMNTVESQPCFMQNTFGFKVMKKAPRTGASFYRYVDFLQNTLAGQTGHTGSFTAAKLSPVDLGAQLPKRHEVVDLHI